MFDWGFIMSSAATLSEQIELVIREIDSIRAELSRPKQDPVTGLAVPKVPARTVQQLKNSVDQFRLFLWAYLDTWAAGGSDPQLRMRDIRIVCAADLLGKLAGDLQTGGTLPAPEARRLREQLHTVESLLS